VDRHVDDDDHGPDPCKRETRVAGPEEPTTEIAEDTEVERVRNPLSRSASLERPPMPGAFGR
jgi:hypothetical protein